MDPAIMASDSAPYMYVSWAVLDACGLRTSLGIPNILCLADRIDNNLSFNSSNLATKTARGNEPCPFLRYLHGPSHS